MASKGWVADLKNHDEIRDSSLPTYLFQKSIHKVYVLLRQKWCPVRIKTLFEKLRSCANARADSVAGIHGQNMSGDLGAGDHG